MCASLEDSHSLYWASAFSVEEGHCTPFYFPLYLKCFRNIDMGLDVDMGMVVDIELNIGLDVGTGLLDMDMCNVVLSN